MVAESGRPPMAAWAGVVAVQAAPARSTATTGMIRRIAMPWTCMAASIRLLIVWGRCLRCPGRQGVADGCLPWGGFLGVAALPFWTPRLLIEICACVAVYGAAGGGAHGGEAWEGGGGAGESPRDDLGRARQGQRRTP